MNKSAELKRNLLRIEFRKERATWGEYKDDRKLFCNTYDMLMESLDVIETINNHLIWVGFNRQFSEEYSLLKKIHTKFINLEK